MSGQEPTYNRVVDSGNKKAFIVESGSGTIVTYYRERKENEGGSITLDFDSTDEFKTRWAAVNGNRYGYIKLYNKTQKASLSGIDKINITSTGYPDSLNWDDFATGVENWQLKYVDHVTGVGGKNFCNWVCGGMYGMVREEAAKDGGDTNAYVFTDGHLRLADESPVGAMMGPGGKCMLLCVDNDYFAKVPDQNIIMGTYLCNIK